MGNDTPQFGHGQQEPTRSHHDARDSAPPVHDQPPPGTIDGYRILQLLGQGGMGMVFEAEQQEPRRRVALKILRGSIHADDMHVRLFRREVETLARLRHPNIASIYGSGRLPDGRPYFAMELVEGQTLDVYLKDRPSPSLRGELVHRLSLMRKIIDAVHYAHQRGVIHRDLKPSNIVVTDGHGTKSAVSGSLPLPEIKILDFGLARITDEDAGATLLSDAGTIRGTLPYMSPEQARGQVEEIDVRSDVYALGVILYEMLAGDRPYDIRRAALAEAVRVICEEPPRPIRATVSGVRRADSDLQTIVFKALAKEVERRYPSASAMAEDIERYLASQPILARPPSAAYQVRKLIRRHRPLFAAAALTLAAIAGASVVSTAMYVRASTEAARADQIAAFLGDMLTGVGPSVARGRDTTMLREILDRTSDRVSVELAEQPEVAAGIRQVLGQTYQQLGEFEASENHLLAALAVHRKRSPRGDAAVAEDLRGLATVRWNQRDLAAAESLYTEAAGMRRRLGSGPDARLADVETDLGNVLVEAGRYDEAEPYLRRALEMKGALGGKESESIAVGLNSLANLMHHRGALDAAESLYTGALAMHRRLLGEDHPDVAVDLNNLGRLQMTKGNLAAAESLMRATVDLNGRLYGGDHPSVAAGLSSLGSVQRRRGDWAGAEASYRDALEMNRRIHGDGTAPVADAMNDLALVIAERYGQDEAAAMQREALAIHRRTLPATDPAVATDLANLAYSLTDMRQYDEAERLYKEALDIFVAARGELNPVVLLNRNNLARLYQRKGDLEAAETLFRKVLAGRKQALGEKHDQVAVTMGDIGNVLRERGQTAEAERMFAGAIELLEASVGAGHPATLVTHVSHGRVLCDLGRFDEAEPELRAGRDGLAAAYGPRHVRTLTANVSLARAAAARGHDAEADSLFESVIEAPPDAIPAGHVAEAHAHYGAHLLRSGRFERAEAQLLAAEKLLQDPRGGAARTRAAVIENLVQLYEKWAASRPAAGKSEQARKWRAMQARSGA